MPAKPRANTRPPLPDVDPSLVESTRRMRAAASSGGCTLAFNRAADNADVTELLIYGYIGFDPFGDGVSAEDFARDLRDVKTPKLRMRINSPGGNVFHGIAIYNLVVQSELDVEVVIDGIAASIASVIAMAGDKIKMAENAEMMIHRASGIAIGNADDMREMASILGDWDDKIALTYAARTGGEADHFMDLMSAETWFKADEAKTEGLIDEIIPAKRIAACADLAVLDLYRNVPKDVRDALTASPDDEPGDESTDEPPNDTEIPIMADDENTLKAATIQELKKKFPDATAEFREQCLEKGLTIEAATDLYLDQLRAQNEGLQEDLTKAQGEAEKAKATTAESKADAGKKPGRGAPGVPDVKASGSDDGDEDDTGDPIADFDAAVAKKIKAGMDRDRAIAAVANSDPALHNAYLIATNSKPSARRLLADKAALAGTG